MADDDLRICPSCKGIFVEDSRMYVYPETCPKCGYDLSEAAPVNEEGI